MNISTEVSKTHWLKITVTISLIILFLTFIFLVSNHQQNDLRIAEGILDLGKVDLNNREPIPLRGKMEFYWQHLYSPEDFKDTPVNNKKFASVPSTWSRITSSRGKLPGDSYATYRLMIKNVEPDQKLALFIPTEPTAYSLFINGQKYSEIGKVGTSRASSSPKYLPQVITFSAEETQLEVIFQVANFYHREGGLMHEIQFGTEERIINHHLRAVQIQLFLMGALVIIGLYHLLLFFFYRKDSSALYFGLFSLIPPIRLLTTGEILITNYIPDFPWELLIKIEFFTFISGVTLFLMFIKECFNEEVSPKILKFVQTFSLLYLLFVIFTRARVFTETVYLFQLFSLFVAAYSLYVLTKSVLHNRVGAYIFLSGSIILVVALINDIIFAIFRNTGHYVIHSAIFIFFFSQAVFLSMKFAEARKKEESWNKELQKKVAEKTQDIRNLLNNAGEGFLAFNTDLYIHAEYSTECEEIFAGKISGEKFSNLIYPDNKRQREFMEDILPEIIKDKDKREIYLSLLPEEVKLKEKYIKTTFKIIEFKGQEGIMVILRDISDKKKLKNQMEIERNNLKMIVSAVVNYEYFLANISSFKNFYKKQVWDILQSGNSLEKIVNQIFRKIHTFNGNFCQMKVKRTAEKLSQFEGILSEVYHHLEDYDIDGLIKIISKFELNKILDEDLTVIAETLGPDFFAREGVLMIDAKKIIEIEEEMFRLLDDEEYRLLIPKLRRIRYKRFSDLLLPYVNYTYELASRMEKFVCVTLKGENILVDPIYYHDFVKSLVHIFRNMIDHGLETTEERFKKDKDEKGNILCQIGLIKDNIRISISDDGRGLDMDKLKAKIIADKNLDPGQVEKLTREEIINYIFTDNFSTKDSVNSISGRGVGLSAVKKELEQLKGKIEVRTEKDKGTEFIFSLPLNQSEMSVNLT